MITPNPITKQRRSRDSRWSAKWRPAITNGSLTPLWLILAMLILVRVIILMGAIDAVYYDEELAIGVIAKDLLEGLRMPFMNYQLADHHGGSLLMGVIIAPLFYLFGQHLIVLKVVPLVIYASASALWFLCCDRYFGRRVAVGVGMLLALSPQLLTRFSLITVGYHSESVVFTAGAAFLCLRMVNDDDKRWWIPFALGFVCGFGTWFAYIVLPTVATCIAFWFLANSRFFLTRQFALFGVGTLVGAAPWFYYNAAHGWRGLTSLATEGNAVPVLLRLRRFGEFLSSDLLLSFAPFDAPPVIAVIVATTYWIIGAAGFIIVAGFLGRQFSARQRHRRHVQSVASTNPGPAPETWFILYPAFLALSYAMVTGTSTNLGVVGHYGYEGFRYLVALQPIVLVIIALAGNLLVTERPARAVVLRGVWIGLLAIGSGGNLVMLSGSKVGHVFQYVPYSYRELGYQRGGLPMMDLDGMSPSDQAYYRLGRAWYFATHSNSTDQVSLTTDVANDSLATALDAEQDTLHVEYVSSEISPLPQRRTQDSQAQYFYRAFGANLVELELRSPDLATAIRNAATTIEERQLPAQYMSEAFAGLGSVPRYLQTPFYALPSVMVSYANAVHVVADAIPANARKSYLIGVGEGLGVVLEFSMIDQLHANMMLFNTRLSVEDLKSLYLGFGHGIAWRFGTDSLRVSDLIDDIAPTFQPYALQGMEDFHVALSAAIVNPP